MDPVLSKKMQGGGGGGSFWHGRREIYAMCVKIISRGENQKGVSGIFGEMEIYTSNESSV